MHGARKPVAWLETSRFYINGDKTHAVRVCRLVGDERVSFVAPAQWKFTGSLSDKGSDAYYTHEEAKERVVKLGREGNLDVYQDIATGKRLYLGRTGPDRNKPASGGHVG